MALAWWLLLPPARIVALDVPPGTAAAIARGETVDVIPSTLSLHRGDTLAIANNDVVVHRVGLASIPPGTTARILVDAALLNAPALLCTIHPSGSLGVSELARPGIEATLIPMLIGGVPTAFAVVVAIMVMRRLGDTGDTRGSGPPPA
ncbi:MAG: hypothetical protein WC273_05765 [Dehalococcoidia bacterium]